MKEFLCKLFGCDKRGLFKEKRGLPKCPKCNNRYLGSVCLDCKIVEAAYVKNNEDIQKEKPE